MDIDLDYYCLQSGFYLWADMKGWGFAETECLQRYLDTHDISLQLRPPDQLYVAPTPSMLP